MQRNGEITSTSTVNPPAANEEGTGVLSRLWEEFHRINTTFFGGSLTLDEIRLSTRKQYGGYYKRVLQDENHPNG